MYEHRQRLLETMGTQPTSQDIVHFKVTTTRVVDLDMELDGKRSS
jgi:hypothetical protein